MTAKPVNLQLRNLARERTHPYIKAEFFRMLWIQTYVPLVTTLSTGTVYNIEQYVVHYP